MSKESEKWNFDTSVMKDSRRSKKQTQPDEGMTIFGGFRYDYGFAYKRDPKFPQDDITWFLMEKK